MKNIGLKVELDKPLKLDPLQEWICNYLDRLNEKQKICTKGILPSNLIKGALVVAHNKKSNPDWMAQSAHSYREILYGLDMSPRDGDTREKITRAGRVGEIMEVLHEKNMAQEIAKSLNRIYNAFTNIAHHFTKKDSRRDTIKIFNAFKISVDNNNFPRERDFQSLVQIFEDIIKQSSLDPLKIHEKIDLFIEKKENDDSYLRLLFSLNNDAKRYFFFKADEHWINWLWRKGFLHKIGDKAVDPTIITYRMPELEYLMRMAEKDPAEVVQIIKSIKISESNFNPEVIERFLWIISTLPAEQIKLITAKIRDEEWVYLMRRFRMSGYEFEKIIQKIVEKKEGKAITELAEAILSVKKKTDVEEKNTFTKTDDPFYVSDLDASSIFQALSDIEEPHREQTLKITTEIITEIIKLTDPDDTKIFDYEDALALYDVDFFTLKIEDNRSVSYRDDVKNLAATVKKLIERTIGRKCGNSQEVKRLFTQYIETIPRSRSTWKLRLFTLSQCPKDFVNELRSAFFKVFSVGDRYFEIEGWAEYHQALTHSFGTLDPQTDQREYVKKVFEYFGADVEDKDIKKWRKRDGIRILGSIKKHLTPDEKKKAREKFGVFPDEVNDKPEPSMGKVTFGAVRHKSPVNLKDFTVEQIAANLKTEWTLERFKKQYENDDFLKPRGVEGLANALKEDLKMRTDEYLKNLNIFYDRSNIHSQYVYSLLRGIEEMFRNKQPLNFGQIGKLFDFFEAIRTDGEKITFRKKEDKYWLADWIEVHKVLADLLLFIVQNKETKDEVHKKYRQQIVELISYFFTIKDSPSKEHEKPEYGEPYHIAINSVRGRAYEVFVGFTENDGKILANDVKKVFISVLEDDSLAVRSVIGRYLATFYFRDIEFITNLFKAIFPKDIPDKKDLYLAAWEGYLTNTLYDKLFAALGDYYSYAIALDPKDYTEKEYLRDLDESLAIHLALAFAHLDLNIGDPLFTQLWTTPNPTRHREFISFIGRSCITRDGVGDEWLKENKVSKEKLITFWDWALDSEDVEPEALSGFGHWINYEKEIIDDGIVVEKIAATLKKSDGNIDWDYGLLKRLPVLAEKNKEKTLEIISSYLLDSKNNLNQNRRVPFLNEDEITEALKIIYKNGDSIIKEKVKNLINTLIDKGSIIFYKLKEVLPKDDNN
jgi:hypothetical protein